jgi:hypothetical protein
MTIACEKRGRPRGLFRQFRNFVARPLAQGSRGDSCGRGRVSHEQNRFGATRRLLVCSRLGKTCSLNTTPVTPAWAGPRRRVFGLLLVGPAEGVFGARKVEG